ncbi:hypothetical protein [Psychrobacter cibarius]|uniref:hypothetical protein n=1 Tax=Psychrobacter cibarius TaxID=282669 RepID=UPI0018DF33E4|nr:hypothetical protein [Psychrobacter cibarius]
MLNRTSACTIVLASILLSSASHAGNIFSEAMTILQSVNTGTLNSLQTTSEVDVESQERVRSPNNNKAAQSAIREVSLSPYQKQVAKEFKDNLKWMYDENMTYAQLAYGSPEKKAIDFVTDKVASSVAQCNGRYFTQVIQGSSLVASTSKAGDIYEITDPSYKGHTRNRKLTKAESLNGEEYKGAVFLDINNTAIKANGNSKWQNGSSLLRHYTLEIVNGRFVDGTPFSEDHLQNLERYQPLQCSDIKL